MTEDNLLRGGANVIKTKYGEIIDISIHMDELPELYKIFKDFNKGKEDSEKQVWVHVQIMESKKGKKYLKFNDYSLTAEKKEKPQPKKAQPVDDTEDDLPF